jgi:hypothetical protein
MHVSWPDAHIFMFELKDLLSVKLIVLDTIRNCMAANYCPKKDVTVSHLF